MLKLLKLLQITFLAITLSSAYANEFDEKLLDSQFASWGIADGMTYSINLKKAWKNFKLKKEVVVAVIDTGIDPAHPFFENNLYKNKENSFNSYGVDFSKNTHSPLRPEDSHGHGTHVSGIIKSIFPKVKILTLKYYNPSASGEDNLNSTIQALKYAVEKNVDIINYSGGGPESSKEELMILKQAQRKGILVVAASGNNGNNIDDSNNSYFPASYGLENIITVTAHDQSLQVLDSSNYGKRTVDVAAPGYRIKSSLPKGRSGYLTGTSQATAFVSGVAALIKSQNPSLSAKEIKKIIKASARKELSLIRKCETNGRLDAASALELSTRYLQVAKEKEGKVKLIRSAASDKSPSGKVFYRNISSKR